MQEDLEDVKAALASEFAIIGELGRGGMATVYLAESDNPRRRVAIKVMNPEIATRVMRERFHREIELASKLTHPHIVPVFSAGETGDLLYYVMPYIPGESLRDRLKREGTVDAGDATLIAREIASALSYAHSQGVVHRDIKPENILLADGHAMVLDFGVARAFGGDDGEGLTRTGVPIGTPAYMSPEQWSGAVVDGRTDLYALGSVLFEMVYGKAPEGPPSHRSEEATQLMRNSGVGRELTSLVPVVARALAADPDQRFGTAAEFSAALQRGASLTGGWAWRATLLKGSVIGVAAVVAFLGFTGRISSFFEHEEMPSRVAVAVLDNQTGDPALDPLGVMAADWITQGLTRTGLVEVVGTRSSLAYAGGETPAESISRLAAATGAEVVIWGAYYRTSGVTRFSVRFTDVAQNRVLLSLQPVLSPADSPLVGVELLRQRVMTGLATLFDEDFQRFAASGIEPPLYDAYEELVAGQQAFRLFSYDEAMEHFIRSAEIDSSFVPPLLLAAFASASFDRWPLADSIARAIDARRSALNPIEGHILDWILGLTAGDSRRARGAIADALQLAPDDDVAVFAGITSMWLNRPLEAIHYFDMVESDHIEEKGAWAYWQVFTASYHLLERHEDELRLASSALAEAPRSKFLAALEIRALAALGNLHELDDLVGEASEWERDGFFDTGDLLRSTTLELIAHRFDDSAAQYANRTVDWYRARVNSPDRDSDDRYGLARALYAAGEYAEAESIFDELSAIAPDSIAYLGYAAAAAGRAGNIDRAQLLSDSLVTMQREFLFGHVPYWRARIAAVLGQPEIAMAYLREAADMGHRMTWATHTDIDLQLLRDTEEFRGWIKEEL